MVRQYNRIQRMQRICLTYAAFIDAYWSSELTKRKEAI